MSDIHDSPIPDLKNLMDARIRQLEKQSAKEREAYALKQMAKKNKIK